MEGSPWPDLSLPLVEGSLQAGTGFVWEGSAVEVPKQDQRPCGAFQRQSNWRLQGELELGEPGVDLGCVVREVAGLASEGNIHQAVLTWRGEKTEGAELTVAGIQGIIEAVKISYASLINCKITVWDFDFLSF